jgi:hypothetical protein
MATKIPAEPGKLHWQQHQQQQAGQQGMCLVATAADALTLQA